MSKQKIRPFVGSEKGSINRTTPKREPFSRLWFLSRGYEQAEPRYTKGEIIWLHPKTNDVLSKYGQKIKLKELPYEKHHKNATRYLALSRGYGSMYLARLKYLTFVGPIPDGYVIDHIDGNTFNNDIRNLRAVPSEINSRDGGFLRKLRNHGINVALFSGIIIEGYERMARWKNEHTKWQYRNLTRNELIRIFVGPTFTVVDPDIIMDLDFSNHREI